MKSYLLNNYDKICIVGDFNYPSVRWDGEWSNNKDSKFVECVRCAFLTQMVKKKKNRRRGPACPSTGKRRKNDDETLVFS